MAMVQTFFLSILLFVQSIFTPLIYDIPTGPVDYGGGLEYTQAAECTEGLQLFKDGESAYVIVVPDDAPESYHTGARWLNEFLNQMLGNGKEAPLLDVLKESQYTSGKFISLGGALGGSALATELAKVETDEGFVKLVDGENIFISGQGTGRGTMYGCASFIEEQLGCRWYTYTLRTAPQKQDIFIQADLNDVQNALFDYRDVYWFSVWLDPEFKAFHKVNSFMGERDWTGEYGRNFEYLGNFCHSLWSLVPHSLFAENPELFAYRKDRDARTTDQRCLTNEALFELVKEEVFQTIERHRDDMNFKVVSVTQEDNDNYCQCADCEAMDALYGGPSGTNIWFTNKVARAIWDEFPDRRDIMVDTFAYTYTLPPPTGIVPDQNVIVRLCSIGCCFAHPIQECGQTRRGSIFTDMTPKESEFAEYMKEWDKLCRVNGAQMYVWDYTTCFEFFPAIYPNFQVLANNLQFFYENSVRGVYEQGYDTGGVEPLKGSVSGEFGEMRGYLLAKLLWDPYQNTNQIMDEFMNAYYGEAAVPHVKEFLDYVTNKTIGANHLGVFGRVEIFTYFSPAECRKLDKMFDRAEAAAAGNAEHLLAVRRSRLCLKFHEANFMYGDYSPFNPFRLRNNKALFHEAVMLGVDRFSAAMVEPYSTYVWIHRPYDWGKMKSWIDFYDPEKAVANSDYNYYDADRDMVRMDLEAYRKAHATP